MATTKLSTSDYLQMLSHDGRNLGEYRKNQADMVENATFTGDIGFRRVYILDPKKGWHWQDAKFSRHSRVSLSKDGVDSYLQFRPKVHYPIGTYVFIPPEQSYDLDINYEEPLWDKAKNLWFIVEKTDDRQFVRYLVIKCDWLLRWVTNIGGNRHVAQCWGSAQAASSYTSKLFCSSWRKLYDWISLNCWEVPSGLSAAKPLKEESSTTRAWWPVGESSPKWRRPKSSSRRHG